MESEGKMAGSPATAEPKTKAQEQADRPLTVLLVDDQAIVGESVRRMLAAEADIRLHFCQDPTQALAMAEEVRPTVILQDLVMPDVDGLMLVKFFRANPATRETPLVVLSSKEEPVVKAEAFARGANDYLVKLPDKLELIARVRYHSRAYLNLLERNEAYRQLEASQRQLAAEVAQAARYVKSLLPEKLAGDVRTDWRFVPSTQLGGDMFGYHWLDPDHLAIYLLDVSGHGVGSSLLAVSAMNVLASESLPDTDFRDPGAVLKTLNETFQMERQDNKFFTLWYGVYRRRERDLVYGNAGHPPALLFTGPSAAAATLHQLKSQGPVIGIFPEYEFDTATLKLDAFARLLVYSDGVFEVEDAAGEMWKFEEFVAHVSGLPRDMGTALDPLLAHVRGRHSSETLADDFSLLEIHF
jgi:sigma-B regulation protein RsbU (phosphoserine phosphatase)